MEARRLARNVFRESTYYFEAESAIFGQRAFYVGVHFRSRIYVPWPERVLYWFLRCYTLRLYNSETSKISDNSNHNNRNL